MKSMNKVLVSGATGFIGSHLTRKLVKEGFNVAIIHRRNSNMWRIKDLIDKVISYDINLQDTDAVIKAVADFKPEIIFHLAAYYAVEHRPEEISPMIETNVLGTTNLSEAAIAAEVKLFVNTSTCFIYEQNAEKRKEDTNLKPLNLYALTKIKAEQACTFYSEKYGLKAITFRLFPPYGPSDHERRLIPYVIRSLLEGNRLELTSGKQKWDFVYVLDIVDAYFKLLSIPVFPKKHEIFNIGTGNAVSVREVVSRIKEIIGTRLKLEWGTISDRKNEVWFTCADINKVKTFLKWEPKVQALNEGLELTVEWYKNFWSHETGG